MLILLHYCLRCIYIRISEWLLEFEKSETCNFDGADVSFRIILITGNYRLYVVREYDDKKKLGKYICVQSNYSE